VKLVGGKTAGAANPGGYVRISAHLAVFVPDGRPVDPLTGTNWEGVGIPPDIASDVAAALDLAHTRALEDLVATTKDDPAKSALWNQALALLQSRRRQPSP
jgi:C-terminal processing protease CtpA/Prc